MDDRLTPEQKDELIEDTLREIPLAHMPKDVTSSVMKHIQAEPIPYFRLSWTDFGLSLVITLCILAVWIGFESLPPLVLIKLRIQGILFWQRIIVNADWLIPLISISLGFGLGFLALINLRQIRRA